MHIHIHIYIYSSPSSHQRELRLDYLSRRMDARPALQGQHVEDVGAAGVRVQLQQEIMII